MTNRHAWTSLVMLLTASLSGTVFAEAPAENQELQAAYNGYVEAFNQHDAAALGAMWAPDSSYAVVGAAEEHVVGREAITAAFKKFFEKSPKVKLAIELQSVRPIKSDVCLAEGDAVVVDQDTVVHSTFSDVWVKTDGKWLLNTAHETVFPAGDVKNEHLREIDWMVGSWTENNDGLEVKTSCHWALGGAFLVRNFTATVNGQTVFRGNQLVGWDPVKKCIRSWMFDSDGGFSEGTWSHDSEHRWTVSTSGVMADGRRVTSKQIIEHPDNDTMLFRQVSREAEGQLLPSMPAIKAQRQQSE